MAGNYYGKEHVPNGTSTPPPPMVKVDECNKKDYNEQLNRELVNVILEFKERYKDREDLIIFDEKTNNILNWLTYFLETRHIDHEVENKLPYAELLLRNYGGDKKFELSYEECVDIFGSSKVPITDDIVKVLPITDY